VADKKKRVGDGARKGRMERGDRDGLLRRKGRRGRKIGRDECGKEGEKW
jgi:hypothetical protein